MKKFFYLLMMFFFPYIFPWAQQAQVFCGLSSDGSLGKASNLNQTIPLVIIK